MKIIQKKNIEFLVNETPAYKEFWDADNWESFTYDCVEKFSKPLCTFIDIGAWIGPITLYAAALNKQCYAIEPDSVAYNELISNLHLINKVTNVICEQIAIFNKDGEINLGSEALGNSNTRINTDCVLNSQTPPKDFFTVPCLTLTNFIKSKNLVANEISMIKIDVEGAEVEIIEDSFFDKNPQIPVCLSIHAPFYKENTYQDSVNKIYEFCNRYSNYTTDYHVISQDLKNITKVGGFYSVMLFNN